MSSNHPGKKQMATCPFNSAHTFQKEKLVFHITRCKDKAKRMPFMAKCKYNPMHFVEKTQIELHQQYCQDKTTNQETINKYHSNFRNSQRHDFAHTHQRHQQRDLFSDREERSRSREGKMQEPEEVQENKTKLKFSAEDDEQNLETLSDCEECQNIIRKFKPKLMQNPKFSKLIRKLEELSGNEII